MRLRTLMSILLFMPFNAIIFGLLASVILMIPALNAQAMWLLPAAVAVSLVAAPLAWLAAPRLRARYWLDKGEQPKALAP